MTARAALLHAVAALPVEDRGEVLDSARGFTNNPWCRLLVGVYELASAWREKRCMEADVFEAVVAFDLDVMEQGAGSSRCFPNHPWCQAFVCLYEACVVWRGAEPEWHRSQESGLKAEAES